jgi:hypothetical protein
MQFFCLRAIGRPMHPRIRRKRQMRLYADRTVKRDWSVARAWLQGELVEQP